MEKIKLVTDSTSDLSEVLIKEHDIAVVPLIVNIGEKSYYDGVTLSTKQMYEKVAKTKRHPKTAAASPGAFVEVFEEFLKQGYKIIYIGIGSKFSGTYQSAHTARNIVEVGNGRDDIYLLDSHNLSSGSGLLLLKAAQFRDAGLSAEEVFRKTRSFVPKVRSQFVIETLEYLHRGGRINGLQHMMGSMLKLKPIIKVRQGEMHVGKKARGSIKNGIKLLIKEVLELKDDIDQDFLMITHSQADESYQYIYEALKNELNVKHIYETEAGCVISSHCGEGTIGILYIMK